MDAQLPSDPAPAPVIPNYGPPTCDPKQAKPLQKLISKMFKPRIRANRHPRQLSWKKKDKKPFY